MGSQFVAVGAGAIDLTDIIVTGYEGDNGDEVYAQTLDSLGIGGVNYAWYDIAEDGLYGWYNTDTGDLAQKGELVLAAGEALWVNATSEDYKLQTAGQVVTSDIAVVLRENFKLVGNNTPVPVDLTDIRVIGYEGDNGDEVYAQMLDSLGIGGVNYAWYDIEEDGLYGWYNTDTGDSAAVGELILNPGEALWVNSTGDQYSLVIPGVQL